MQRILDEWPVWAAFVLFFLGAFVRGAATYGVGRGLRRAGDSRQGLARQLDRPTMRRAEQWIGRWGAPVVSLGFLTVGVQTAINATAGLLNMPLRRYVPALVVGALIWATVYVTVGMAVIEAALGRVPWWWAVVGLAVLVGIVAVSRRLRAPQ
ncbi:MAG: VTT domain-containing protein [Phycicoccus sp.]|nr:VTT domain-containing protein [Phycicoccus sp.]